uniref:Putative histidinol dehydrogenase n=1 Tax=termite gut metagenome TaxID=433724 RepID=S0DG35_9ZZZZ
MEGIVRGILEDVRLRGDAAVLDYTERFDGVRPENLRVTAEEIRRAADAVDPALLDAMREAAENIADFHRRQVRQGFISAEKDGIVMGQRVLPLACVGVYVPGGTAAYPSTVLMDVVPAKIAGVGRIVMVTPPGRDGAIPNAILAAASIAGVDEIYRVGGAQAVGALCYGTQTLPQVDKIVGPGNIYVATAKKQVYGLVDIDMIAGPSDILIVADESADAAFVAADMLGQAEHDELAASVLVTTSGALAELVRAQLEAQLDGLSRADIARASLLRNGRILLAENLDQALATANALAPEHLELCVAASFEWLPKVRNAGSVFLGHHTPEALGDYFAGPNHTLPTGGSARFYSPLSVDDYVKKSSFLHYSADALKKSADKVIAFAESEGLTAHAESIRVRLP